MEMLGNKNVSLDKGLVKDVFSEENMLWQTIKQILGCSKDCSTLPESRKGGRGGLSHDSG